MPWEEAKRWKQGKATSDFYQKRLDRASTLEQRNSARTKVVKPSEMPWEDTPQGKIKWLVNQDMDNVRVETIDAYTQELPPGGRSGKHCHTAEECLYIVEGKGYDLHWDVEADIGEVYTWRMSESPSNWEWEEGDCVYIPPRTVHQHFNADPAKPCRFISAQNRVYRAVGYDDLTQIEEAP
ncbi:MAG: cupin domain-containing protein [Chloroflexi bacterium]|nr:cupin domain-containing protein [Chloroflexota bacterium]